MRDQPVLTQLAFVSALDQARLIRTREISPVEMVEVYARRIDSLDKELNAYLSLRIDAARSEARQVEKGLASGEELGPFAGVTISIKDLNDVAGSPTTLGTQTRKGHIASTDDRLVASLRAAGFIVLGKTNTAEFGTMAWTDSPAYGPCRNPHDPKRNAGGSSGGAAAALAAGLCAVSQGSDGGGSIRIPASACGVFGLKPSRGRVPPARGVVSMLSQSGPITRTVADAAALLDVMAGSHPEDAFPRDAFTAPPHDENFLSFVTRDPGKLKIAVSTKTLGGTKPQPDIAATAIEAGRLLASLGHEVVEDDPGYPDDFVDTFLKIWASQQAAALPEMPPTETLDPVNAALIEIGHQTTGTDLARALARSQLIAREVLSFFDRYDALVTPTLGTTPPINGSYKRPGDPLAEFAFAIEFAAYTQMWNATGQPAASVPLFFDNLAMPIGTQIVTRPHSEGVLLSLCAQLERAKPWHTNRPKIS